MQRLKEQAGQRGSSFPNSVTGHNKFVDSSKLKRHYLTHTGQKDFVCPHLGCGKAFSLDFNLRSHLKTHALENYHICHFPECDKRFTSDSKLRAHVKSHEKAGTPVAVQYTPPLPPPPERPQSSPKASAPATTNFADRPYLQTEPHLKTQHPEHGQEENGRLGTSSGRHAANEPGYQYGYAEVGDIPANPKRSKTNPGHRAHSSKAYNAKISIAVPSHAGGVKNQWSAGKVKYEDDSEETEEDGATTLRMGGDMATMLMMRKRRMKIDILFWAYIDVDVVVCYPKN
ncbi:LOW QUALITY PROTEIN: hypothetical protein U9M48_041460 [Paspalum notatum var. saurae]|uniref:C2H2-type domain-containing protein n=1 Tax=Paspalum notatum var. saurae TaxID=547442 RepID=A0AAQ3UNE4_PASNO